jgi:VIT1/CCC1 family predicted Fe2+/Mn2+ transporter
MDLHQTNRATMAKDLHKSSKRVLEPHERIAEVLFGLIMVLTFTGSLSVAEAGRSEIRVMLIGALGCNFAWGIIDGVLYVMGSLAEKGRNLKTLKALRQSADAQQGQQLIAGALPPLIASVLQAGELETMRQRLMKLPEPPATVRTSGRDWFGALGVFFLVFLSTFPVALPFILMQNAVGAMRVSNAVAVVMLFITGVAYGRCVGRSSWGFGAVMVVLGLTLVALTIALGG